MCGAMPGPVDPAEQGGAVDVAVGGDIAAADPEPVDGLGAPGRRGASAGWAAGAGCWVVFISVPPF